MPVQLVRSVALPAMLVALIGCRADSYRYFAEVHDAGDVHILEGGRRTQLHLARVRFTSGLGGFRTYLTETVQRVEDEPAVRRLLNAPAERRPTNLYRANSAYYRSDDYAWRGRLHWIVGIDPYVIAIGGEQGWEAAERGRARNSPYPLVGSPDLTERVTHLVVFHGRGRELLEARDPSRVRGAKYEVLALPQPMSLDEVLQLRTAGRERPS